MEAIVTFLTACAGFFNSQKSHSNNAMASHSYGVSNTTILNFDDIPTINGLARVPQDYGHLIFSSYNVISPRDPAFDGQISGNDLNCAVSPPNALIGSRYDADQRTKSVGAYFRIYNGTSMIEDGLYPYFSLLNFNIKPMDAPPPRTTITIKGYSSTDRDPLEWHVDFDSGYHLPLHVKMHEFSGVAWDQLYGVEILADFGEDALDWEFCVDDIELQFFKVAGKDQERVSPAQAVLHGG